MRHTRGFDPVPRPTNYSSKAIPVSEALTGSSSPRSNPYTSSIPTLVIDGTGSLRNLPAIVEALKTSVESLTGRRGDLPNRAVIFKDLVDYGILTPDAVRSSNGSIVLGGGGTGGTGGTGGVSISAGYGLLATPDPIAHTGTMALDRNAVSHTTMSDVAPPAPYPGDGWWDTIEGQLYIWYDDGTSAQWVVAVNQPSGSGGNFVETTGDTMTGSLDLTGAYDPSFFSQTRFRLNGRDFATNWFDGTYRSNVIYDASGNPSLWLGDTLDDVNYYQQSEHWFSDRPGSTTYAKIGSVGVTVNGQYLYLNNGSGTVNTVGGPLIYADNNYVVIKPGSNDLGVWFQAYNGTGRAVIGPNGFELNGGSYYHYGARLVGGSSPNTGYNMFYTNDGSSVAIHAGGTNDRTTYYRNTRHNVDNLDGTITYGWFAPTGSAINYGNLNIANGSLEIRSRDILRVDTSNNSVQHWLASGSTYYLYSIPNTTWYDTAIHNFRNAAHTTSFAQFDSTSTKNVSGVWATLSDVSLKDDIAPYKGGGLDAVAALRPVTYRYKPDTPFADPDNPRRLLGLLAHEVEDLFPEIVGEMEVYKYGTVKTLEPGLLIYPLIIAVRELKERLERLENGAIH